MKRPPMSPLPVSGNNPPDGLDIRYMLEGTPVRMRYTTRWATSRVSFPENVAEHSWFVCFYSMLIARWAWENAWGDPHGKPYCRVPDLINYPDLNAFLGEVLQRAVLHDIEESRTGDIHRPFKHSTPELKARMAEAGELAAWQVLSPLARCDAVAPLLEFWRHSKDYTTPGRIVNLADMLAVIAFVKQEGGDVATWLCLDTLPMHFEQFKSLEYDFLRPLVDQASVLVKEVLAYGNA